ncbi:MAG TPA: hypothetical protein DCR87_01310 [Acidobacteria bacterium]|nr:hypothetical protein [Acidobacteriota bacterium]
MFKEQYGRLEAAFPLFNPSGNNPGPGSLSLFFFLLFPKENKSRRKNLAVETGNRIFRNFQFPRQPEVYLWFRSGT